MRCVGGKQRPSSGRRGLTSNTGEDQNDQHAADNGPKEAGQSLEQQPQHAGAGAAACDECA